MLAKVSSLLARSTAISPSCMVFPLASCSPTLMSPSGWVATPLFHGEKRSGVTDSEGFCHDATALTWTFCCEAENFGGPLLCYPPHHFTRRIEEWAELRGREGCSGEYLECNPQRTLAYRGPKGDNFNLGGEFPNLVKSLHLPSKILVVIFEHC